MKKLRRSSKSLIPKLKRKLKILFHAWVRRRDGRICISCGQVARLQAGHFMPDGMFGMTRFHYKNVNGQCVRCNLNESGNQFGYAKGLDKKYGGGTAEYLYKLAKKNKYQDEVSTLMRLIEALKNNEDYPAVYEELFLKYK